MYDGRLDSPVARFFWWVTGRPKTIVTSGLFAVVATGVWLPRLTRDPSAEAFIPPDDPALVYREKVRQTFGLADPIVVLVVNNGPTGVFNPDSLRLVHWLTQHIAELEGVNPDRVTSLATEDDIVGTDDEIAVKPFMEEPPVDQEAAEAVRRAVMDFDLYVGNLVSHDGQATVIVAELLDDRHGKQAYEQILDLVRAAPVKGEQIHVAGEGAATAHLGDYIDADMARLNVLCGLVITVVLFTSYRTMCGVFLPTLLVAGSVVAALGLMAAARVPFYVITNALPVVLIAIGVADGIHILGQYYEESALRPGASQRELVVRTMVEMWRPVIFTSLTDIAGFMGICFASVMPPMKAFGVFASVGTAVALLLSALVIPACLVLMRRTSSPAFRLLDSRSGSESVDRFGRGMAVLGRWVTLCPVPILLGAGLLLVGGVVGITRLEVNAQRIGNFKPSEPIYQADLAINEKLNGTNYLDVVVETTHTEGLFRPENLQRIEDLQAFLTTLPHVKGTLSITDYLKQINRAMNEERRAAYRLPESEELVAQYFLLHSAGANPTDLEHLVDFDYRVTNIRTVMDSGLYSDEKVVVEAAEDYIQKRFNTPDITAHLAGRVNVDYHWVDRLSRSHLQSVVLALAAVWLTLVFCFRSWVAGLFAVMPVLMAVLLVYAVMGVAGIWLSIGTSMFAAIAIGTGVDFAVHTLHRLIVLVRDRGVSLDEALAVVFPSTGRALLFSFSATLFGFSVLVTSHVPPLINFGALVTVSIAASFLASLIVLPALVKIVRPRFLGLDNDSRPSRAASNLLAVAPVMFLLLAASRPVNAGTDSPPPGGPTPAGGQQTPASASGKPLTGDQIAGRVNGRDDGRAVTRTMIIKMTNRAGKERTRETRVFRKYYEGEKKTVIFYLKPKNVKGTAFLNIDYFEPDRDDDRWLYLPAHRKVRRIAASDRGDYFLGTDFTYEDINNETRVNIVNYKRKRIGTGEVDGHACEIIEAVPIDDKVKKELGYGKVKSWVDAKIWMLRKAVYWDTRGKLLKTIHFRQIRQVQEIWTAHQLEARRHQTGHSTTLIFKGVNYETPVDDDLFTQRALRRGL